MSRVLRLLCIWCLALVLPLQGLAAGCLMNCAGTHPPAGGGMAAAAAAVHPCHGVAETQAAASADGLGGDMDADTGHRCSACAACGMTPALPAAAPLLGTPGAARESDSLVAVRPARVAVAGPERPPRAATA